MIRADHRLRRLRFDLEARQDESIPGAIARGVAGHHLVKLNVVLKEVGLSRYGGATQLADPTALERIADVLRCDATSLTGQAGRRLIEPGDRRLQHFIDFDGLVVPSGHIELRRRRISPLALAISPHHRQSWLMSVLPFCATTLERLIDECPHCDAALGWVQAAGIGCCETCLRTVPPNPLPPLPEELVEDYRLFAGLVSLKPSERAVSVQALAPRVGSMSPGALARLALRCGLDCGNHEEKRAWQTRAGRLPAEHLARTTCRGIELLRTWPEGIRRWAHDRIANAADAEACRGDVRRRIQRIAWGDSWFDDQRRLVQQAFPDFEPPLAGSGLYPGRLYTGREARRVLPGFHAHAAKMRQLGIVPDLPATPRGVMCTQRYPAAPIDAAAKKWADAVPVSTVVDRLRLPLYAVEQMFDAGLLAPHDDAILAILLRRPQAVASVFEDFIGHLGKLASRRSVPSKALPIGLESRRIGGRPKPWSDIYQALLGGRIRFWLMGGVDTDRLMVARGSLDGFIAPGATDKCDSARMPSPDMSTNDAAELLNVIPADIRRLRSAGVLSREIGPRAMTTPRSDVEQIAAVHVSAAELARRVRTSAEHVNNQLRQAGFANFHGLWPRMEAIAALPLR